ncbi:MAG: Histidine-tRNA ligase [Candidatus Uhrbacteria bacterium GW2011_GWF2_41_16]|uniref:Histidine--tRNA ligase n=2 Tax=Candidatus Uhriibacteriota TaxID=1752732 RepID=A0A0G0VCZ9_9BACT|nr:MAG: Histidine-tRNA ligase [Candidatus Uhrbacteria bacterium GW2011_GWA2_41_10]KKR87820.1 MAG: Histidine-tRNA ligase [Candidatus Uhrbacteria bacterium GW2011_GWC2_41_11]KKR98759.1 MAG: Histidine-tRNA ligase [Candidatus Uhrbacteria bacterium GW2011_GWF2_41_16]HBP00123.1 histidine--tRNA ligase [Candidatus Uhrbacteria bacterium]
MPKKVFSIKKSVSSKKAPESEEELFSEPSETKKAVVNSPSVVRAGKRTPELLRGFRDILPDEQPYWDMVRDATRSVAEAYSFDRIDLPILEREELILRTIGKQTDIVEKEMYAFEDQGGDRVVLRPEMTASAVRAYINHGMLNLSQPVKLYYMGPNFRYERPQAGRYRQHHQIGFEVMGSEEPILDAQLMVLTFHLLKDLGIDTVMHVNSIGTLESRQQYKTELTSYYRSKRNQICEDCKRRLLKNPLRLLDCKVETCQPIKADAPQILDWLDEDSKNHFMHVLEFLDEAGVPYTLDSRLVRGLDYYTRTVFEIWAAADEGERSQNSLGGGGRYDNLIEMLGGREGTPACGVALGMERIILAMRELQVEIPKHGADVFFAQLGDAARRQGLRLFEECRRSGIRIREAFGKNALKTQLELANKCAVPYTLILGQKEVLDGTIIIRDMESGAQEIADVTKIVSLLKKKLEPKEKEEKS